MLARKKLDEAEKQIAGFKPDGEYEAGYLMGLQGILNAMRKPVESSVIDGSAEDLDARLKSIIETVETHYLSREEEGYFAAWVDLLRKLSRGKKGVVK
jgi:hypothetical protein